MTKKEYGDKIELLKLIIFHLVTDTHPDFIDEIKKQVLADVKIIRDEYYRKADEIKAGRTPDGLVTYVMKNINRINL
jgi:hypothetical protein